MTAPAGAGAAPGSVAEEATRLVEALAAWARSHAGDVPGSLGERVGHAAECRLCPLCQALGLLRQTKPETFAHLLDASAALTAALRSVVEGAGAGAPDSVQRINLDDDPAPRA